MGMSRRRKMENWQKDLLKEVIVIVLEFIAKEVKNKGN